MVRGLSKKFNPGANLIFPSSKTWVIPRSSNKFSTYRYAPQAFFDSKPTLTSTIEIASLLVIITITDTRYGKTKGIK